MAKEQKDNHEAVVVAARVLLSALAGAAACRDVDGTGEQRICGTCWTAVDDYAQELYDALAGEGLQETVANPADTIQ